MAYSLSLRHLPLVLMLAALAAPAAADDSGPPTRAQLDALYLRVLDHPQDRVLTLQYAALAMRLKDYEAAIPPLERILMSEPGNAKIKVQVGILYEALGSKLIAKQYFTDAKNTDGVTPAVAQEAEEHLRGL